MEEREQLPFSSVLDKLFTADPLPLDLLYRLSDMSVEEAERFWAGWTAVPDERRRVIVRHLTDISEENFVVDFVPIFRQAMTDSFAPVRVAALDGVWDATNTSLVEPIIGLMQTDEDEDVRAAAAGALAHYVLLVEWNQLPAHISPPIVEALLAEYEKGDTAVAIKRAALEALGAANHPRVPRLIAEAYENDQLEMQLSAVFAMGNSADSRWLVTVIGEMQSPSEEMRAEAARAAGAIGSTDAVESLANLVVDEELLVALAAVEALGQIGSDQAADILRSLLDDPDFVALQEAIEEALEETTWLSGDVNFDWLDVDEV